MTSTFRATFTRYDRKTCQRVTSGPQFVNAEDFQDALARLVIMKMGMNAVNPKLVGERGVTDGPRYDYDVASLAWESLGGEKLTNDLYGLFGDDRPAAEDETDA